MLITDDIDVEENDKDDDFLEGSISGPIMEGKS